MPELPRPGGHPKEPVISCNQARPAPPPSSLGISGLVQTPGSALAKEGSCTGHHGEGSEWGLGSGVRGLEVGSRGSSGI